MQCVDLFCGAGGFSSGAASAGLQPVLGVDSSANALQVFQRNHAGAGVWEEELGVVPAKEFSDRLVTRMWGRNFHVHGSPPCQSVSRYNTKALKDNTHNSDEAVSLTVWFLDLVQELKPSSWSMEQVQSNIVRKVLDQRKVHYAAVDFAVAFGLPQTRRRIIAGPEWLVNAVAASSKPPTYPSSVLTGPLALPEGALIQSAVNNTPIPKRLQEPGGRKHRRINPGEWAKRPDAEPAPTVTKSPHRIVLAEKFAGTLRLEQTMALQGFPSTFTLVRKDTGKPAKNRELLVGNAVPPPVGQAIAQIVISRT